MRFNPLIRRADDVTPSLQRLMHQLAQRIENNLFGAILPISDFPNQCLGKSALRSFTCRPPLSFSHLRRPNFSKIISVRPNNFALIELE
ncbi:MAG: hypothetical protein V4477_18975 [Pseudomonadota bacterium]